MKHRVLIVLASALVWGFFTASMLSLLPSAPEPVPVLAVEKLPAPVDVAEIGLRAVKIDGEHGTGSGVPVARVGDRVLVLTAKHVTTMVGTFKVTTADGHALPVLSSPIEHPTGDVALFWIQGNLEPVRIAEGLRMGQRCYAAGYPLGLGWIMTEGFVGGLGWTDMQLVSSGVIFGMSGGPVLDAEGRLIGLCRAVARDPASGAPVTIVSVTTPVVPFLDWINQNLIASLPAR